MHAIERSLNELIAALDAKDAGAVASLLSDDAMLVDEVTRGWLRGRETIRQSLDSTFASVDSISSRLLGLHIRASSDSAVATCTLEQTYVLSGTRVSVVAPTSFALEADGSNWRVVLMHSVPIPDA